VLTGDRPRLDRFSMAARAARDIQPGMIVNLGVGIPTLVSLFVPADTEVLLHAENGMLGYGPVIEDPDRADPNCINAGGQPVERRPGMSFMTHDMSFELIRGGWIDVAMLGGLQVGANGDLANYHMPGRITGSIGGGQDLAYCSKKVVVIMSHIDKGGRPKIVDRVALPITAPGCVDRIITDIAVIDVTAGVLVLQELLAGWTAEEIQEITSAPLHVAADLVELTL
jgi:3-oxoacid CoA-transferase subunit B